MQVQRKDKCIVIPAAGSGSRLGLDHPKELYEISPGKKLIDLTMSAIPRDIGKVVVVVTPEKEPALRTYLEDAYKDLPLRFVYFRENLREWPGSIYSARDEYLAHNFVFLPDSVLASGLSDEDGTLLIDRLSIQLQEHDAAFAVVPAAGDILRNFGSVNLSPEGRIVRLKDKPSDNLECFNGFWGAMAFRKEAADDVHRNLMQSLDAHLEHDHPDMDWGGFFIDGYMDLGTWKAIERMRSLL